MTSPSFPKVLFISDEIPQSVHAGSIQFFRIFESFPAERLTVFGPTPVKGAKTLDVKYYEMKFPLQERLRLSRFTSILSDLQSKSFLLPKLSVKLERIADEFKPDVIVTLMQHITYYYPAYYYAKKKGIPFVIFCHDDAEAFSRIHARFKNSLRKLNSKIYSFAEKRICVSPQMAKAWEEKYGPKGEYFYPVASNNITSRDLTLAKGLRNPERLTIGYAGSLAYGYREGINEIISALEKTDCVLKIFLEKDTLLQSSPNIQFEGFAKTAEETWERIKQECDIVILPYSLELRFKELYSTHFPSKLPEYLRLGMPVLITGPGYATGAIWAKEHSNATLYSDRVHDDDLSAILNDLKLNEELRVKYSINSLKVSQKFSSEIIKNLFLSFV